MFYGIWGWIHALKDDRSTIYIYIYIYIYICVCVCVYNKVLCKGMMMANVVCWNTQIVIRNEGVSDGIRSGKLDWYIISPYLQIFRIFSNLIPSQVC